MAGVNSLLVQILLRCTPIATSTAILASCGGVNSYDVRCREGILGFSNALRFREALFPTPCREPFCSVSKTVQPVEKLPRALFCPLFRGLKRRFCRVLAWVFGYFGLPTGPTTTFSTGSVVLLQDTCRCSKEAMALVLRVTRGG